MTDEHSGAVSQTPGNVEFARGFPPPTIPTIFADGVLNVAPSPNVVKFYLFRSDPDAGGGSKYKNQVVMQVVMPMHGFVHTALFFERSLKHFLANGTIPQAVVDGLRKLEGQ